MAGLIGTPRILFITVLFAAGITSGVRAQKPLSMGESIFRTYFEPTPRSAMDSYPSRYQFGKTDLEIFRKDSVSLYKGISQLKMGKAASALPHFQLASRNMKNYVSNVSEWYLALTYLKLSKYDQAAYMFHKVAETEIHPYQNEAEVIYQQLLKTGSR